MIFHVVLYIELKSKRRRRFAIQQLQNRRHDCLSSRVFLSLWIFYFLSQQTIQRRANFFQQDPNPRVRFKRRPTVHANGTG